MISQAHCKKELSSAFGAWKQKLLIESEAVIRSCGAQMPISRLYTTGNTGDSQDAPDEMMAGADVQ